MLDIKRINFDSMNKSVSSSSYLDVQLMDSGYLLFGIASGFVSTTEISFVNEGIVARVTAAGEISFLDGSGNVLAAICVPVDSDGRGCYRSVSCKVHGDVILVRFPIYTWIDNYPHCDGEYDRWEERVIGYKDPVAFNMQTHVASVVSL